MAERSAAGSRGLTISVAVYLIRWFSGVVVVRQATSSHKASQQAEKEAGKPVEVRRLDPDDIAQLTLQGTPLPLAARRQLEAHRARQKVKRKKRPARAPEGP